MRVARMTSMILIMALLSIVAIPSSYAQQPPPSTPPFQIPDIREDIKILTATGRDGDGNAVSMELILSRGTMMMTRGTMMMDPTMMFSMPMMIQMMQMGMGMSTTAIAQMQQQMNTWMRSHHIVQGGSIIIGDNTYMIDAGNARISDDGRVFVNAVIDQGLNRNGKVIGWGMLDSDDGLKGRILLWESRTQLNSVKFTANGSVEDVF